MTKKKPRRVPIPDHVKRLRTALTMLSGVGWKEVVFEYSGYGDSTDEHSVVFHHEDGSVEEVEGVPPALLPKIFDMRKFLDDLWLLPPCGFENNEGGKGAIALNCASGAITVHHDEFYTEARSSTWSY